ncbi:Karyopherin transporter [Kappamyces sp. JEL0680]|nr:Karyopherin transporter [Kappamyces sp. JEL0680]
MWKVLPPTNRQGIKNFIIAFIIKTASDEVSLERNRTLLGKLNIVLVQDSEEIFDFSAEQMTQSKTKALKSSLCGEFSEIFQLCHEILEQADKTSLVSATLHTLLRFLNWIPLGYIFETNLINLLCNRFFIVPAFRNVVLKCLTEIGSLQVGPEYNEKFVLLYGMVVTGIKQIMPVNANLATIYEESSDEDQNFIQNLGLFLSSFYSVHLKPLEAAAVADTAVSEAFITGHRYLIKVSEVKDREVFKVCLEYWTKLVAELYDDISSAPRTDPILNLGGFGRPNQVRRATIYAEILSQLRTVMIEAMVRPEEVLIVENDEGEIVRETLKESDTIILYKSMREVLVYLTHLDVEDTERIMSAKLEKQVRLLG